MQPKHFGRGPSEHYSVLSPLNFCITTLQTWAFKHSILLLQLLKNSLQYNYPDGNAEKIIAFRGKSSLLFHVHLAPANGTRDLEQHKYSCMCL